MITMRFCAPSPTSRRKISRLFVAVGLGVMGIASCGVDKSGLGSMPFLPHDASSGDSAGIAGVTGSTGTAVATGTAGDTGAAGNTATGVAGTGGDSSGSAGNPAGDGGVSGAAGTTGATGSAGTSGDAGGSGAAGITGTAGVTGSAGTGVAGVGGTGVAGTGGAGLAGVAGTVGTAGRGGGGGTGVAGTGGRGGGNVDGGPVDGGDSGMVTPCNPTTCPDGCCSGNSCVKARTAKLCGAMGATCAPCAGCQLCSTTGQCRIDTASRWTIVAVSAELPNQISGRAWDRNIGDLGGSKPDPFCEYENPAGQVSTTTAGTTDTVMDTFTPTWNQTITPVGVTVAASTLMSNNPTWQIWVGDDDGCSGPGGCLGDVACTIRQTVTEAQLTSGQLVVSNHQSCNSVTLKFVCQAPATAGP